MEALKTKDTKLRFEMNFRLNSLNINDALKLLEKDLGYKLDHWGMDKHIKIEKAKEKISEMDTDKFFYSSQFFYDSSGTNRLVFSKVFPAIQPGVFRITWIGELDKFQIESFEEIMKNEAFYAAYLFWEIDEVYQNNDQVYVFESRELPYDKSKAFETEWGYMGLPIEGNPGRRRQVCNMYLVSVRKRKKCCFRRIQL